MASRHGRRRGRRARERGALAAHLRRHDHAADGAVHGAVLDLLGEHLEVPDAPGVAEGRVLGLDPVRRPLDPPVRRRFDARTALAQQHRDPSARAADADDPAAATTRAGAASQTQVSALMKEAQRPRRSSPTSSRCSTGSTHTPRRTASPNQVKAQISSAGLVVTVLTDKLLFDSGSGHAASRPAIRCSTRSRR